MFLPFDHEVCPIDSTQLRGQSILWCLVDAIPNAVTTATDGKLPTPEETLADGSAIENESRERDQSGGTRLL